MFIRNANIFYAVTMKWGNKKYDVAVKGKGTSKDVKAVAEKNCRNSH